MAIFVGDALLSHANGGCYICARGDSLVDTEVTIVGEGALVICKGCVQDLAQAARIALIISLVQDEGEVSADSVDRAVALVRYFQGQAAGLLQSSGSGSRWERQQAARTKALGRYLLANPGSTRADIIAAFPDWAMDSRALDRLLEPLIDLGVWGG